MESRFGSATVRSMASRILLLQLLQQLTHRQQVLDARVVVRTAVAVVVTVAHAETTSSFTN